jgi:tetratricopeptide (TPR) repeat protein
VKNALNRSSVFLPAVSFWLCLACNQAVAAEDISADATRLYSAGKEALAGNDSKRISEIIERLAHMPGKRAYSALLASTSLVHRNRQKDAAEILRREFKDDAACTILDIETQLDLAQAFANTGDVERGLAMCDRIGSSFEGTRRSQASLTTADIMFRSYQFEEALSWVDFGRQCVYADYPSERNKTITGAFAALERQNNDAIDCRDHGSGFSLYLKGNQARFAGDTTNALLLYDRLLDLWQRNRGNPVVPVLGLDDPKVNDLPIHPVYASAAQVYRALVLVDLERYDEAAKSLIEPGSASDNPYQGEALRVLGDIALESRGDIANAERHYSAAIEALATYRAKAEALERYSVPSKSLDRIKPAPRMHSRSGWGNLVWFSPKPEQIYNPMTCEWYVPYQTMQAQTKRSLCRFLNGDVKNALVDLDVINQIDQDDAKLTRSGLPSNFLRLRDGYRSGGLFASDAEAATFRGNRRILFAVADFYIETEQYREAERALGRIDRRVSDRLNQPEAAYLAYARLAIKSLRGDSLKEAEVTAYLESFGRTPSAPRAWMLKASLATGAERLELYRQIARRYPESRYQLDAMIRLAQIQLFGSPDARAEAVGLFKQIRNLAPGTAYDTASQSFLLYADNH